MSELPPRDSFVAEVAYIALRDELNLEITSLRAENSRLSALAGKMREVGNRILAAGQGTDYPDSRQALRDALSLTPVDMGEWRRKEEVEKTESSIADTPDQNEWSVVVALIDELSTLRAKLAEKEKCLKISHIEWAETDTKVKRLAESVGVQGDSNDGYFRTVEMVVEDLVKKLAEVEKERDEGLRESNPRLEQAEIALREAFDERDSAKARIAEMGEALTQIMMAGGGDLYATWESRVAELALAKKGAE